MNVETMLREGLAEQAADLTVPADPYAPFVRRESRHRRTRRVRIGLVATAVTVFTGLQAGVIPMPGWAPGIAIAGTNDALINSPVRGSLAGDSAFLAGMRRQVKDMQDPGELWRVTDRRKIRFLYAGDVGDRRLVLAYVPVRFGFITDPQLVWYGGDLGAAPEQMEQNGNVDADQKAAEYVSSSFERPGLALLVGPQGSTASISPGYEFAADGRLRFDPPVTGEPGSGVAQTVLPPVPGEPAVTMTLTRNGRTVDVPAGGGFSNAFPDDAVFDAAVTQALAGRQFDREMLGRWIQSGLNRGRMRLEDATVKVRWTGTVNDEPAALFTLQERGHGVLAFAMHGTPALYRDDLRLLLPAATADRTPIAWRLWAGENQPTDQVIVTAPAGTARLMLTPAGGRAVPVQLDQAGKGTATLAPTTAATVTAYAKDGTPIGSAPVLPFDDGSGLIGQHPATRVVD